MLSIYLLIHTYQLTIQHTLVPLGPSGARVLGVGPRLFTGYIGAEDVRTGSGVVGSVVVASFTLST